MGSPNSQSTLFALDDTGEEGRVAAGMQAALDGARRTTQNLVVPKTKKRIQITSRESYAQVLTTMGTRQRRLLRGLAGFNVHHKTPPTAYELFQWLQDRDGPKIWFDLNSVRPHLTKLKDMYLVQFGPRRRCGISNKNAYTWEFASGTQEFLPLEWPK